MYKSNTALSFTHEIKFLGDKDNIQDPDHRHQRILVALEGALVVPFPFLPSFYFHLVSCVRSVAIQENKRLVLGAQHEFCEGWGGWACSVSCIMLCHVMSWHVLYCPNSL
jgi:hypothetical protein